MSPEQRLTGVVHNLGMERQRRPLDAGLWALICCPVVAWAGAYWATDAEPFGEGSRGATVSFLTFFFVMPAVLAAVGTAVVGQRGRDVAHASFWAVIVTWALWIPMTALALATGNFP